MKKYDLKLKEARQKRGLKQSELGDLINMHQTRISEYENGRVTPPLDKLVELAQILDVTLDELVEFKKIQHNLSNTLKK